MANRLVSIRPGAQRYINILKHTCNDIRYVKYFKLILSLPLMMALNKLSAEYL